MNIEKNSSTADFATSLRFWLIRKIAGDRLIMLNARLSIVPRDTSNIAKITGVDGALFAGLRFGQRPDLIIEIKQVQP